MTSFAASPIDTAIATYRGHLRTVANGCERLRTVADGCERRCVPCLYFTRKEDGCRKGDACAHCHLCTPQEARTRRNRMQALKQGMTNPAAPDKHLGLDRYTFDL
eukprot:s2783_g1.t1